MALKQIEGGGGEEGLNFKALRFRVPADSSTAIFTGLDKKKQ